MKHGISTWLVAVGAFGVAWVIASHFIEKRHASELARQQAAWEAERTGLQNALKARQQARALPATIETQTVTETVVVEVPKATSPEEILARLIAHRIPQGTGQSHSVRQAVHLFESMVQAGPPALPVIRGFLGKFQDISYDTDYDSLRRGWRDGRLSTEFVLAPTLRVGLMDVVRRIGGAEAESILAEALGTTGRGMEVAYLTVVLQTMAPNKYRQVALTAAHDLLNNPMNSDQASRVDRYEPQFLFGVLSFYQDQSYAGIAQTRLVSPTGEIDRYSLSYLERTLGEQSLVAVAQAYQNPAITNGYRKEPLVDVVVRMSGESAQANALLNRMIQDENLPLRLRESALRDLDDEGFDDRNPGERDRQIIIARMRMIEAMRPGLTNPQLIGSADRTLRELNEILNRPVRLQQQQRAP
ncbi:MAG: hypothetical protein AB1705_04815 [Verrucomicrobiota bacterium]